MIEAEEGAIYILEDKVVVINGNHVEQKYAAFLIIAGGETQLVASGEKFGEVVWEAKKTGNKVYAKSWVEV